MKVIKRDGRKVSFDRTKIVNAVLAAFKSVDGDTSDYAIAKASNIADYIEETCEKANKDFTINEIQTMVQHGLMSTKRKDVAEAYILFRDKRDRARQRKSKLFSKVRNRISASNVLNDNANMDEYSFGGREGQAASELFEEIAFDELVSQNFVDNHNNNRNYIHDRSSYAVGKHNCLSIPFDKLLEEGFITRQTDVRPANSINTALQLVAVISQLQSLQQFGGVSATHLDWTMVPYVRKSFTKHMINGMKYCENKSEYKLNRFLTWLEYEGDGTLHFDNEEFKELHPEAWQYAMDMTEKECQQAVEGMYHNLNTLQSRSGNQLPFTSINYGTCTLPEGRMVTKALLEGCIKGVGKYHKTSIFPCGIFQCMKGVNRQEGDPNYDLFKLAIKSTAQRLYPNYANVDWSGNEGYDKNDPKTFFSTMGCRTANGWDANGFGQLKDGRGNICPNTIILPEIAMCAKEKCADGEDLIEVFMKELDIAIHDSKDELIERFDWIAAQDVGAAVFMYENGTMTGYIPERGIKSALCHGTLAIGQLGLAECLQILIDCDHTEPRGMELAKRIEQLFKDRCAEFKKEVYTDVDTNGNEWTYHLNFGVYYTPAENLCYTAMKKFQKMHGCIPKVSDRDYFTNSMHVPVWKEISPIEKINIESQLTGYSSAGCITYVELDGGAKNNLDALETLINYAMDKDIPYFALNVPVDLCLDCGYSDEMDCTCPMCGGSKIQKLRRVTGYLTGSYLDAFNPGKIAEVEDRYKHVKKLRGWKQGD